MDTIKAFLAKEIFRVNGFHLTVGLVVVLVLIYTMFVYKG